ncbi:MAG: histidine kinase [Sulfurimonas sp.]|nr:MAG: histidine kinase [Sulfurimonas sp.]
MNHAILERIEAIPPLPQNVEAMEQIIHDPTKSFADYQKIIEKDPVMTADILRNVNAPIYGFRREITSLQQAIALFGMGTVRSFVVGSIVKKSFPFDMRAYGMSERDFEQVALSCSAVMLQWVRKRHPSKLLLLEPAAFLVNIGKILLSQELQRGHRQEAFEALLGSGVEEHEAERELCGMTTAQVSAEIFDHWGFETDFIRIIRYSDAPHTADHDIKVLSALLKAVRQSVDYHGNVTDMSTIKALYVAKTFDLDQELLQSVLNDIASVQTPV